MIKLGDNKIRMKIRTKIFGGFTIVLMLLIGVAYVGHSSLSTVERLAENTAVKANEVNLLVMKLLMARQQEKNFIIRGDEVHIGKVRVAIGELTGHAERIGARLDDNVGKKRMEQVAEKVGDYAKAFESYVELARQRDAVMSLMREKARIALAVTDGIRTEQNRQLDAIREKNRKFVAENLTRADDANRLIKYILQARAIMVSLISEYDGETLEKWNRLGEKIRELTERMKSDMRLEHNVHRAERAGKYYGEYENALLGYLGDHGEVNNAEIMNAAMADAQKEADAIRADQKAQLRASMSEYSARTDDKMLKTEDANRIARWFLNVRKNEKEFIISNDSGYFDLIRDDLGKILGLTRDLISRFGTEQNIHQGEEGAEAVRAYQKAFIRYAELMREQETHETAMVQAAREARGECEAVRLEQMNRMGIRMTSAKHILLAGTGMAILSGLLFAFLITRGITGPLNRVIKGLGDGFYELISVSEQVSSVSRSLARDSSGQSAAVAQASVSLRELSSMTRKNADNAIRADHLMKEAGQMIEKANTSMDDLTASMDETIRASEETFKIVKNIDEIAFQTNLLALNAAVEAARAGEAGAGFAVVADEVRNLAMRSAVAARTTSELIESTVRNIRQGSKLVSTSSGTFSEVSEITVRIADFVGGIATASDEQARGIEQVKMVSAEMDRITRQNSMTAQKSASASQNMDLQAKKVEGFVDEMALLVRSEMKASGRKKDMPEEMPEEKINPGRVKTKK